MYTTYEEARKALDDAEADVRADYGDAEGEELLDSGAERDLVVAVLFDCEREAGRELARTVLGYVPNEHVAQFGQIEGFE